MIRHLNPIRFRQGSGSKAGKTGRNDAQVLTAREQAHALAKRSSQASKRNDSEANAATKCMHFGMVEPIGHAHSAMTRKARAAGMSELIHIAEPQSHVLAQ